MLFAASVLAWYLHCNCLNVQNNGEFVPRYYFVDPMPLPLGEPKGSPTRPLEKFWYLQPIYLDCVVTRTF